MSPHLLQCVSVCMYADATVVYASKINVLFGVCYYLLWNMKVRFELYKHAL